MRENKLYDKKMYELNAGGYCGVYMEEDVMKQIIEEQEKYTNTIKKILNDNKDKLLVKNWTLANRKNGDKIEKQIIIDYAIKDDDVDTRIKLFTVEQPKQIKELYILDKYSDIEEIIKEIEEELYNGTYVE